MSVLAGVLCVLTTILVLPIAAWREWRERGTTETVYDRRMGMHGADDRRFAPNGSDDE